MKRGRTVGCLQVGRPKLDQPALRQYNTYLCPAPGRRTSGDGGPPYDNVSCVRPA